MAAIKFLFANSTSSWVSHTDVAPKGWPLVSIDTGEIRFGNGVDVWANLPTVAELMESINGRLSVWSNPLLPAGSGGGVIRIDETAAPNIPDHVSSSGSKGVIAAGRNALGVATGAPGCIAIGDNAMGEGQPGDHNLAVGAFSLTHLNGGHRNIGLGSLSGHFLTTGYQNIFMGRDSGHSVTTGYQNVGIGYCALGTLHAPIGFSGEIELTHESEANKSTAVGVNAASWLTGSEVVAVGTNALYNAKDIIRSVYIGNRAGEDIGVDVSENGFELNTAALAGTYSQSGTTITITATAHGLSTGKYASINFTSGGLTASGRWQEVTVTGANTFTIQSNTPQSASGNVTITERETATAVSLPGSNTVIGHVAQGNATRPGGNVTIVGFQSGLAAEGRRNTLFGANSGRYLTSGQDNVALGYGAGMTLVGGGNVTTQSNWVAIGHEAPVEGDNTVRLGGTGQTVWVPDGQINGTSDRRYKKDIEPTPYGLDFINAVEPVQFKWKTTDKRQQGIIAQQVEEVSPDFTGITYNAETDKYGAAMSEFIAPLIKSVQELSARVVELEQQLAAKP